MKTVPNTRFSNSCGRTNAFNETLETKREVRYLLRGSRHGAVMSQRPPTMRAERAKPEEKKVGGDFSQGGGLGGLALGYFHAAPAGAPAIAPAAGKAGIARLLTPHALNSAIALWFQFEYRWRGVSDAER